jgi:RNA polymerase sigma-70 factor (ECF subfamily)
LQGGSERALNEIYERYWEKLYAYACARTKSHDLAFEITQELFIALWVKRAESVLQSSLSGYLFAAMRNDIIDHIRVDQRYAKHLEHFKEFRATYVDNPREDEMNLEHLEDAIERSLKTLPKNIREIFRLSRQQNKSTKEIAEQMKLSPKTVENSISLALKHLRVSLGEFMVLIIVAENFK